MLFYVMLKVIRPDAVLAHLHRLHGDKIQSNSRVFNFVVRIDGVFYVHFTYNQHDLPEVHQASLQQLLYVRPLNLREIDVERDQIWSDRFCRKCGSIIYCLFHSYCWQELISICLC